MRARIRGVVLALVLAAGCTSGADEPVEPVWGKQACEHCAMLVSDKAHAAQLMTTQGDRLYFDDPGCMVAWTLEHPGSGLRLWVRTSDTQEWLPAEKAGYEPTARTPMGFGFVALSEPGTVTWSDVTAAVQRKLESE